ncbi:pyrroline-5-carboxylate reductase, partial [Xanthomonas oryzae pv. oryzae]
PMLADALRVIGPVPRSVLITAQFAADRAGRTLQCIGDGAHRHPGFM